MTTEHRSPRTVTQRRVDRLRRAATEVRAANLVPADIAPDIAELLDETAHLLEDGERLCALPSATDDLRSLYAKYGLSTEKLATLILGAEKVTA